LETPLPPRCCNSLLLSPQRTHEVRIERFNHYWLLRLSSHTPAPVPFARRNSYRIIPDPQSGVSPASYTSFRACPDPSPNLQTPRLEGLASPFLMILHGDRNRFFPSPVLSRLQILSAPSTRYRGKCLADVGNPRFRDGSSPDSRRAIRSCARARLSPCPYLLLSDSRLNRSHSNYILIWRSSGDVKVLCHGPCARVGPLRTDRRHLRWVSVFYFPFTACRGAFFTQMEKQLAPAYFPYPFGPSPLLWLLLRLLFQFFPPQTSRKSYHSDPDLPLLLSGLGPFRGPLP